jgi:hypothetical protein
MAHRHTATCALIAVACCLSLSDAFTSPQSKIRLSPVTKQRSLLFLGPLTSRTGDDTTDANTSPMIWGQLKKKSKATRQWMRGRGGRVRRAAVTLCAALFLWVGTAGYAPQPAHAAPMSIPSIERILPSASLDQMVDRYVKDHMFDDDVYDPVESTYRETYDDLTTATYPTKLKDVTAGILGKDAMKAANKREGENKVIAVFQSAASLMTKYLGVSEKAAQVVLAVSVFASACISFVSVFGGISFVLKNGMRREMKKRYGDDYRYVANYC